MNSAIGATTARIQSGLKNVFVESVEKGKLFDGFTGEVQLSTAISVTTELLGYEEKLSIARKFQKNLRLHVFPARNARKIRSVPARVKKLWFG